MRWRVEGVDADVRKVAREAAKAAGLPLGPWLERAIGEALSTPATDSLATPAEPAPILPIAAPTEQESVPPRLSATPEDGAADDSTSLRPIALWPPHSRRDLTGAIAALSLIAAAAIGAFWLQSAPTVTIDARQVTDEAPLAAPPPASPSAAPRIGAAESESPQPESDQASATPSAPAPNPPGAQAPVPTPAAPQTLPEIVAELQREALNGDAMAQHDLALAYVDGRGVPQNYEIAAAWFEKAAAAGLERAQFNLAVLYENALGVPQDFKRAFALYKAAAEQGFAPAQHNVAVAYAQGRGTARDYHAAALWFRRAADQGIASAQFNLGMIYEQGLAGPPDPKTAYGWYRRAAASGSQAAIARLAALESRVAPPPVDRQQPQKGARNAKPTRTEIAEIQRLLGQLSFDPGPADGKAGPSTRAAIRRYEKVAGLKVTGKPTAALLAHLRQVTEMMRDANR